MSRINFYNESKKKDIKTTILKVSLALALSAQLLATGFVAEAGGGLIINSPVDGSTVDQQSITINGVGGPDSYIHQIVDGRIVAETMTDINGNWELRNVDLVCGTDNQIVLENSIFPATNSFSQNYFSDWAVTLANGYEVSIGVNRRYIEFYQTQDPVATVDLGIDSEAAALVQYGDYVYVATSINNPSMATVISKINISNPLNPYIEDTFLTGSGSAAYRQNSTSIVINQDGTTLFVGPSNNYQVDAVNTTDGSILASYNPINNGGSSSMSLDISDSGQYLYIYNYDPNDILNFSSIDISSFNGGADGDLILYGLYEIPAGLYASLPSGNSNAYDIIFASDDPNRLYLVNQGLVAWINLDPTNEGMFVSVVENTSAILDSANLMVKADCESDVISQVKVLPNTGSDNSLFIQISIVSLGLFLVAGLKLCKGVDATKP
ncbi:hypothetical protein KA531_02815 [Candidatus Saccharibacteria bacterium]|nr:hypothetical protein [Candidatus Saccharibacteria bacterium]